MTLFYPGTNSPDGTGALLLYALRLLFGSGMVFSIIYGFIAIRRGDMIRHRAWMTRAYAIGLGAGTQVLTGIVGELTIGTPNELENALLMGAAWGINVAVAAIITALMAGPMLFPYIGAIAVPVDAGVASAESMPRPRCIRDTDASLAPMTVEGRFRRR